MSERTFLLGEYGKGEWYVTESELKRRLSAILVDVKPEDVMDGWIDILLHGGGKEWGMSERRLRKLAQALCDKLRKVHSSEEYKGIWVFAKKHGLSYDGPTYSDELALLDAYLNGEGKEGENE